MKYLKTFESRNYWTEEKLQAEANKYKNRLELKKNNKSAYNAIKSRKWTNKKLQEEVNKYQNRNDFRINNNAAYLAAYKKNILDKLFNNHINNGYSENKKISGYWNKERLQDEANKYITRIELRKNNKLAYDAAHSKGLLGDLFKNHYNQGYSRKRF